MSICSMICWTCWTMVSECRTTTASPWPSPASPSPTSTRRSPSAWTTSSRHKYCSNNSHVHIKFILYICFRLLLDLYVLQYSRHNTLFSSFSIFQSIYLHIWFSNRSRTNCNLPTNYSFPAIGLPATNCSINLFTSLSISFEQCCSQRSRLYA